MILCTIRQCHTVRVTLRQSSQGSRNMLVVPTVLQIGHTTVQQLVTGMHSVTTLQATQDRQQEAHCSSVCFCCLYTIFWMGDDTVAGGGWGGDGEEEEDTGSALGGTQATSGRGWGQAEPDQASLVHLICSFLLWCIVLAIKCKCVLS